MINNLFVSFINLFHKLKQYALNEINTGLLLFLILMANHRYYFKLIAILLFFVIHRGIKIKKEKINIFYILMIAIAVINFFLEGVDMSVKYGIVVFAGSLFWILNLLVHNQISYFVDNNKYNTLVNTLKVFIILNFLISFYDLIQVMFITQTINPYTAITIPPPYGSMSGDLIRGFFGINHLPNACVAGLLFIFFLYKKEFLISCLSLLTLLMASSNLTVILVFIVLISMILLVKDKLVKYYSICAIAILLAFYAKINTFNYYEILCKFHLAKTNEFYQQTYNDVFSEKDPAAIKNQEIDSILSTWEKSTIDRYNRKEKNIRKDHDTYHKQSYTFLKTTTDTSLVHPDTSLITSEPTVIEPTITEPVITGHLTKVNPKEQIKNKNKEQIKNNFHKIWNRTDSLKVIADSKEEFEFGQLKKFDLENTKGHVISLNQTKELLLRDTKHFLFGNGVGNFSSRIAMLSSKEKEDSRLFDLLLPKYEHKDFTENHKALWKYIDYLGTEYHSFINLPFSVYNQILGEYGIIGFLCFGIFYIGYFLRKWRRLEAGKFILPIIILMMGIEYWFESLTLLIFFELVMLIDLKSTKIENNE
ncbi:MAG: hypothetical protein BGO87_13270 [Flavobacteriia bacterium 40-80]|nr:MAG: hypothetical protein BGO87_13270 [Flavobacteriia bacterium 40-80]